MWVISSVFIDSSYLNPNVCKYIDMIPGLRLTINSEDNEKIRAIESVYHFTSVLETSQSINRICRSSWMIREARYNELRSYDADLRGSFQFLCGSSVRLAPSCFNKVSKMRQREKQVSEFLYTRNCKNSNSSGLEFKQKHGSISTSLFHLPYVFKSWFNCLCNQMMQPNNTKP
jgi:hypothetical protein